MPRHSNDALTHEGYPLVEGAPLEPIRVVRRELVRPDGTRIEVDVPVYPPFRLLQAGDGEAEDGQTGEAGSAVVDAWDAAAQRAATSTSIARNSAKR